MVWGKIIKLGEFEMLLLLMLRVNYMLTFENLDNAGIMEEDFSIL